MIVKLFLGAAVIMSLPQESFSLAAHSPKIEALKNIEMLQNLAFLIEHQSDLPDETREHVKMMQGVLDDLSRHFLPPQDNRRPDHNLMR